jgi:hypothetical protein
MVPQLKILFQYVRYHKRLMGKFFIALSYVLKAVEILKEIIFFKATISASS